MRVRVRVRVRASVHHIWSRASRESETAGGTSAPTRPLRCRIVLKRARSRVSRKSHSARRSAKTSERARQRYGPAGSMRQAVSASPHMYMKSARGGEGNM